MVERYTRREAQSKASGTALEYDEGRSPSKRTQCVSSKVPGLISRAPEIYRVEAASASSTAASASDGAPSRSRTRSTLASRFLMPGSLSRRWA